MFDHAREEKGVSGGESPFFIVGSDAEIAGSENVGVINIERKEECSPKHQFHFSSAASLLLLYKHLLHNAWLVSFLGCVTNFLCLNFSPRRVFFTRSSSTYFQLPLVNQIDRLRFLQTTIIISFFCFIAV